MADFPPSGTPQDHAMPALVVAMAGKPTCSSTRADPPSQALGSTKPGPACRASKAAAVTPAMLRTVEDVRSVRMNQPFFSVCVDS